MEIEEYSEQAVETAVYPDKNEGNFIYPALGLAGEAGEVAEKIKKILRDEGGELTAEKREQLGDELGDVLWYWAALCRELELSPTAVASQNIEKLADRQARDKIQGSGDNR